MPVSPKRGANPRQQHRGSNSSQHPPPSPDRSSATGSPRRRLSRLPNAQYPSSSPTSANAPNHLGNTGPSFTRGTTLLGGSRETSASMRQQPNTTTITVTTSDDNNRALTQAVGRAFEPSSPQRRRRAQLPRQTEEQLMALYLKYDGITMDKVPNLVAELNLTIPVDFDVSPYFSAQAGATTAAPPSSSAIAVAGGGGAMSNILQPEDLMQFVVDLQYAVGHPNNVVLDTCQVISQQHQQLTRLDVGTPTLAESTTNMETSRSMSIRPSISGPSGYVNAGDFVERANIEDALS